VVSPIAETTTTTSFPLRRVDSIRSATAFMRAESANDVPPNFWTTIDMVRTVWNVLAQNRNTAKACTSPVPKVAAAMTDRRRRQKEQRAAKRKAEKKQTARRELGRRLGTALVFGVLVVGILAVGAFFGDEEGDLPRGYEGFRQQPTACGAEQPPPEQVAQYTEPEEQADITPSTDVTATLQTSCGEIVIQLDPAGYPETVNSFVFLAREGFYNGQVFYRVVTDVQLFAGDPLADGTGGPGYRIPDEFPAEDFVYTPGVVAMDNEGRGTTGSQFFVVPGADADVLNPLFNVLGQMISGQDALDRIQEVETARRPGSVEDSLPLETVYIESVTIDVTGS